MPREPAVPARRPRRCECESPPPPAARRSCRRRPRRVRACLRIVSTIRSLSLSSTTTSSFSFGRTLIDQDRASVAARRSPFWRPDPLASRIETRRQPLAEQLDPDRVERLVADEGLDLLHRPSILQRNLSSFLRQVEKICPHAFLASGNRVRPRARAPAPDRPDRPDAVLVGDPGRALLLAQELLERAEDEQPRARPLGLLGRDRRREAADDPGHRDRRARARRSSLATSPNWACGGRAGGDLRGGRGACSTRRAAAREPRRSPQGAAPPRSGVAVGETVLPSADADRAPASGALGKDGRRSRGRQLRRPSGRASAAARRIVAADMQTALAAGSRPARLGSRPRRS